jgi:hypothetical protein
MRHETESVDSNSSVQRSQNTRAEEVEELMKKSLEMLSSFPMPIGSHNRVKEKKSENVEWKEEICVRSWNETMEKLDPVIRQIMKFSIHEPDSVVGGKRYLKQECEYFMLQTWVRLAYNAYTEEKKELFLHHINTNNLQNANSAWDDYYSAVKNTEQTTSRIVRNIRKIFLEQKIFCHTIKGENQSLPVVKDFFQNPTINNFETLVRHHWKYHIKARFDQRQKMIEEIDANVLAAAAPKTKRINFSDEEKRRIKDKTNCKCVGLPYGLPVCNYADKQLPYTLLDQEHRLQFSVFADESDENRWGMCASCHRYKTVYIDCIVKKYKDDHKIIDNYKLNNTLPELIMQEIRLRVGMETPKEEPLTTTEILVHNKKRKYSKDQHD